MGGVSSANIYETVDQRARNVPSSVRRKVPDLVQYLTEGVTDQKLQVRAFFVWIANNIRYDADGYFGRSQRLPGDPDSVLRLGKAVCEGYANLMEAFCKEANIEVKTISGFSKGYSFSPDKPYNLQSQSNHSWTAVRLRNKWRLIDATWAAGYLNNEGKFEKHFNDYHFLTDPSQFVNTHFPYWDGDIEASRQWQLLRSPISLQQFNESVSIKPSAFRLSVEPKSHKKAIIEMRNEVKLSFRKTKGQTYNFSSMLMLKTGNIIKEVPRSTFDIQTDSEYTVRLHPREVGSYVLRIFGSDNTDVNTSMAQLFEYVVKCKQVKKANFEFPYSFPQCQTDKCYLVTPTQYHIKANTEVQFEVRSPRLQKVMVSQTNLLKSGNTFKGRINVGKTGGTIVVYGSTDTKSHQLKGLYRFEVS